MKKHPSRLLSCVLVAACLLGIIPANAATSSTKIPKFLVVGNSYARDALSYLPNILKKEGVTEYTIGYLYYGGCTLEQHASFAKSNALKYSYRKITQDYTAWDIPADGTSTMLDGLQDEAWDYVFLQQGPNYSGRPETYNQDLDYLIEYVKENVSNPNVKLGWHMTWAYAQTLKNGTGFRAEHFNQSFQGNPQLMFEGIVGAVQAKVLSRPFSCVIPSGTTIENVRASHMGDTLQRDDGFHLNDLGKVVAAHCWYACLTGKPIDSVKYKPSTLTLSGRDKAVIVEAVNNSCKNPYAVTPSSYLSINNLSVSGGGQAEINGKPGTQAPAGATVTLRYDISHKCTQFNGWEVREGGMVRRITDPVTTFVMPDMDLSIRADVTGNCPSRRMTDLSSTGWYHDAVDYVLNNGIMSGYDESTFGPDDTLTRAQVVQVLYNKRGKPAVTAKNQFTDVPADQWFFDAVRWAADMRVVSGVGDGKFNPNGKITLEQAAVILHNYSGKPSADAALTSIGKYSSWAADALRWCVANNLLKDIPFENATDSATRAQTAQILYNYLTK